MTPFFSIVIPLYNKADYIEKTLQSVFNQSFQDYEIIIINDGSTDNSLNIAKKIVKDKPNVELIDQNNQGLSTTRNLGIQLAKGKVIALLDADDQWENNYLREVFELNKKFPEALLFGTDYYEKYNDNLMLEPSKNIDTSLKNSSFIIDDFFNASLFQPIICPSSLSFKKEVFNDVKFKIDIDFAEDVDFYIEANLKFKFAYCYKALVYTHFDVPNQLTKIGFKGKRLPNFDEFEKEAFSNFSLKKYLDTNRYFLMIQCRLDNDQKNFDVLSKHLDKNNLTSRQKLLLQCPKAVLIFIKNIKKIMLKRKVRLTSY